MNYRKHYKKFVSKKLMKGLTIYLSIVLVFQFVFFPVPSLVTEAKARQIVETGLTINLFSRDINHLPSNEDKQYTVKSTYTMSVTAYNAGDIYQCDDDPCIAANGENICEALDRGYKRCAANFVPFGTILNVEGYGICMVTDRMNSRYYYRVDIAMKESEKKAAREWGHKVLKIEILELE